MGRGRAKAKQQKVARDLKYNTPTTDLDSLQRELGGSGYPPAGHNGSTTPHVDLDPDDPDLGDEDDGWAAATR